MRIPLLVTALVVGVAVAMGQAVLSRLERDQERHLADLASVYLDGLATAVQPAAVRADTWEAFDALDRARTHYGALRPMLSAVLLPDGTVLAAADARALPAGTRLPPGLAVRAAAAARTQLPTLDRHATTAVLARDLIEGDVPVGRIVTEADIAPLLADRHAVARTLMLVNGALVLLFAGAGVLLVRRLLAPAELVRRRLAEAAVGGRAIPIDVTSGLGPEHAALLTAWNRAAAALAEREEMAARLAEEERHAQIGRLTAAMAHEVNNPLGGLMTVVDTLEAHGHDASVRSDSLGLLKRGLRDIRNVVRAGLVSWRGLPGEAPLAAQDLEDLRLLVRHEVVRRSLDLDWRNELPNEVAVDRTLARQVVLNLLLNAAAASPPGTVLTFEARERVGGGAIVEVADRGCGLPHSAEMILDAPDAPAPAGGGLGLWTAVRLARSLGGSIARAPSSVGTRLVAELPATHATMEAAHAV